MPKAIMGRASIFRGKEHGQRVQAIITKVGGQKFEAARKALRALCEGVTGSAPSVISDADVVEYLARGDVNTRKYLEGATK